MTCPEAENLSLDFDVLPMYTSNKRINGFSCAIVFFILLFGCSIVLLWLENLHKAYLTVAMIILG